jgi:hypothetical protein
VLLLLVVLLAVFGSWAASPERAAAFVGETYVVAPGGLDVTNPAKSIITKPTFITGGADGPVKIAGEVATKSRVLSASGLLPRVAAASPWVAGAAATYTVCELLTGGCLDFLGGLFGSDPPKEEITWAVANQFTEVGKPPVRVPMGEYYTSSPTTWKPDIEKTCGSSEPSLLNPPTGEARLWATEASSVNCGLPKGVLSYSRKWYVRGIESNRGVAASIPGSTQSGTSGSYCYVGLAGCTDHPNPKWSETLAKCLTGAVAPAACGAESPKQVEELGQHIASKVAPSEVSDPYDLTVVIPDCDGLLYPACEDLLEELDLKPVRVKRDWSTADPDQDPDEVLELDPARATEVEKGSTVTVVTNPEPGGMPIIIPAPNEGETYEDYAARLNPALVPERRTLDAAYAEPALGPDVVVSTNPAPETRLNPETTHTVRVRVNPPDLAPPLPPGGGWTPPDVPSIDFGPLANMGTPCTSFPFGLFCWIGEAYGQFNVGGQCPQVSIPVWKGDSFDVDGLCSPYAEQMMSIIRPVLLFAFIVGCGFLFARGTRAIGGGD